MVSLANKPAPASMQITANHLVELERERMEAAGGRIDQLLMPDGTRAGPNRIFLPDAEIPALTISRSLGDAIGKTIGVSSDPYVTEVHYEKGDFEFIILGNHALWAVLDNEEAVTFVHNIISTEGWYSVLRANHDPDAAQKLISVKLINEARERWIKLVLEGSEPFVPEIAALVVGFKDSMRDSAEQKKDSQPRPPRSADPNQFDAGAPPAPVPDRVIVPIQSKMKMEERNGISELEALFAQAKSSRQEGSSSATVVPVSEIPVASLPVAE